MPSSMSLPTIKNVAIVGAGISGVCTAARLLERGIQITIFERRHVAGGVWAFDEAVPNEPTYPCDTPSRGDFNKIANDAFERCEMTPPRTPDEQDCRASSTQLSSLPARCSKIEHAPPGACYAGLRNNVPLNLMQNTLRSFPAGVDEFDSQVYLEQYIQGIAEDQNINERTLFNTRVEDVRKADGNWRVRTSTRIEDGSGHSRLVLRTWFFDAVVVASGHYHMPRIPDIPGLKDWKAHYPERVGHSKSYRRPAPFKDRTVLLIGAGTSSTDIAKELVGIAKHTYQSSRGGAWDRPASMLPDNATRVGGIAGFEDNENRQAVAGRSMLGTVLLQNGQRLCNIDHVILCTGYVTSYPFLSQYHDDAAEMCDAGSHTLVTREGSMVHNLHKDIFYMEDPTLVFIGKPYNTANFSLFDIQSQLVSRVFAGLAALPSKEEMRDEYDERIRRKGLGREFHSLLKTGAELEYVDSLVAWGNQNLRAGVDKMRGHSDAWKERYFLFHKMIDERLALKARESEQVGDGGRLVEAVDIC